MNIRFLLPIILALFACNTKKQQVPPTETKFPITAAMVTQTSPGDKTAARLFDGDISTAWFPGWAQANYPQRCVVDFGKPIKLSKIRWFDGAGQPTINVQFTNTPDDKNSGNVYPVILDKYQQWDGLVDVMSAVPEFRYLVLVVDNAQGEKQLTEVEVYTDGATVPPIDTTTTPPKDTTVIPPVNPPVVASGIGQRINLSGFHWVPLDKLKPFKTLRIYVASNWVWQKGGLYVEPMFQAGSPAVPGFDTYLAAAKAQGLEVMPCINQTPAWYRQGWFSGAIARAQKPQTPEQYSSKLSIRQQAINGKAQSAAAASGDLGDDYPPVRPGADRTDPKSYKDFADFWGQFVMRYGSVKHDASKLRVDQTPRWSGDVPNQPKSGLNLIRYVEIWNEPDKWWKRGGSEDGIYMKPQEYAALLLACYDAIKAADPNVQVVMAGLTGFDMPYLQAMADYYRAKGVPFKADIINLHHYSNRGNELGRWPPTWYEAGAVCPEADKDFVGVVPFVTFAHSLGKQIWITEFGSDTRAPSWMFAAPFAGFNSEQLQAQWLARTYLEYFRLGVDNCFMFNAINEPGEQNGGLYLNSGLMYGQNSATPYAPKPSYNTITKMIADLNGAAYLADLSTANVRIVAFRIGQNTRLFYWSPTMTGATATFKIKDCSLTATEWPQFTDIQQ